VTEQTEPLHYEEQELICGVYGPDGLFCDREPHPDNEEHAARDDEDRVHCW
jgi:hypothetical protein